MRRRRRSPLQNVALDALTLFWVARGLWRVSRGRVPWKGAS